MGRHGHAFKSNHIVCVTPWEDGEQLELLTTQKKGVIFSLCFLLNCGSMDKCMEYMKYVKVLG